MPYTDLLRVTVFITGAEATVARRDQRDLGRRRTELDHRHRRRSPGGRSRSILGFWLGRPERAREDMREPLASATHGDGAARGPAGPDRAAEALANRRLRAGLRRHLLAPPAVPVIGAGYALGVALAWRRREAAVTAIEERDGVRFYVEPGSALAPTHIVRTPGLGRDRAPAAAADGGLTLFAELLERRPAAGVGDVARGQPGAACGGDAVDHVGQRVGAVGVGVDADHHAGL